MPRLNVHTNQILAHTFSHGTLDSVCVPCATVFGPTQFRASNFYQLLSGLIEPAPFFFRLGVSPEEYSFFGGDLDFLFGFFLGMFRH